MSDTSEPTVGPAAPPDPHAPASVSASGAASAGVDALELELRRLPGVRAAGFVDDDDLLLVHLDAVGDATDGEPGEAVRIAARHSSRRVGVEIVRHLAPAPIGTPAADALGPPTAAAVAGTPPGDAVPEPPADAERATTSAPEPEAPEEPRQRARLLSVLAFPDTDEVEVHLLHGDRRTIGRGRASGGVEDVARATIAAVEELGRDITIQLRWARRIDADTENGSLVGVSLVVETPDTGRVLCYGLAGSHGPMDASARATLDALNRQLERLLAS